MRRDVRKQICNISEQFLSSLSQTIRKIGCLQVVEMLAKVTQVYLYKLKISAEFLFTNLS